MIQSNYCFIIKEITKLESSKLSLQESLSIIDFVRDGISKVESQIGLEIRMEFDKILSKSPDLCKIRIINDVITGQINDFNDDDRIKIRNIPYYKFALITSVDVERTFSRYKSLLRENRSSFSFENLSQTFFVMCNSECDK